MSGLSRDAEPSIPVLVTRDADERPGRYAAGTVLVIRRIFHNRDPVFAGPGIPQDAGIDRPAVQLADICDYAVKAEVSIYNSHSNHLPVSLRKELPCSEVEGITGRTASF